MEDILQQINEQPDLIHQPANLFVTFYDVIGFSETISFYVSFTRKLSFHLLQTYLPSGLFVVVAWLSLIVPPEYVPGRMAICMTTLLSLTSMFAAIRQITPNVSYIRALDIWIVSCILMVVFTLLEYTIVLRLRSMPSLPLPIIRPRLVYPSDESAINTWFNNKLKSNQNIVSSGRLSGLVLSYAQKNSIWHHPEKIMKALDNYSIFAMPVVFFIFNCAYWPWLLFQH